MKRYLSVVLCLIMLVGFTGCGKSADKDESSTKDTNKTESEAMTETKSEDEKPGDDTKEKEVSYYAASEMVDVSTDKGAYKFTILEAKLLPATDVRDRVLQVKFEYDNIDFKGKDGILYIDSYDLKVKDSGQYVLQPMNTAWDEEWTDSQPIKPGEKCVAEHTFKLDDNNNVDKVYVAFDRLDKEFELTVEQ